MVKGLAKLKNRLRHGLRAKYVDVNTFMLKVGYSPMTAEFYLLMLLASIGKFPEIIRFLRQKSILGINQRMLMQSPEHGSHALQ